MFYNIKNRLSFIVYDLKTFIYICTLNFRFITKIFQNELLKLRNYIKQNKYL